MQRKLLESTLDLIMAKVLQILPMVIWSVLSQIEQILRQGVSWVVKAKSVVRSWDQTILGSCFASELPWSVTASLVENLIWEDILVALDAHNKGSEVKIFLRS